MSEKNNKIKIIWNITNKCWYNCRICATRSRRVELSFSDKKIVLTRLCQDASLIEKLDFAGGDPLIDDDSTEVINEAIMKLGNKKVAISTTSIGINKYTNSTQLPPCEIELTLDVKSATMSKSVRNEQKYSIRNLDIVLNKFNKNHFTINLPLIDQDINIDDISEFIDIIKRIKKRINVKIIRLMPVGEGTKVFPIDYEYESILQKLIELFNLEKIKFSVHCALKFSSCNSDGKINTCGMAFSKVGIDCSGNVFACAWSGYVYDYTTKEEFYDCKNNPYYLGNLLDSDLITILNNNKSKKLRSQNINNNKVCSVIKYFNSGTI